jgi:hypothetical protein
MAMDKTSLSYRAGYDAYRSGKALADDPGQLFEDWHAYEVGYIDAMSDQLRTVKPNANK